MTQQQVEQPEAQDQEERKKLLRQAYSNANSDLREKYRSEFDALYAEHAQRLGVDYTPRLTPEQKAEKEMAELLERFPHLREKVQV